LLNALWLLHGLKARGSYQPQPGWGRFTLQVMIACLLLAAYLAWAAQAYAWLDMPGGPVQRVFWVALVLAGAALLYLGSILALGLNLRQLLRR
jgi:putative peptidoglycan lipid II flippase